MLFGAIVVLAGGLFLPLAVVLTAFSSLVHIYQ